MAADPRPPTITLEQFYGGKPTDVGWQLDAGFVRRQEAIERAEWEAALAGGPGGEQAGAPTEQPKEPDKPSAIMEGVKAAGGAFVEAGKAAASGVEEMLVGGREQMDLMGRGVGGGVSMPAIRKVLVEGLMGMVGAPFVGLGVGAGQALENADPGLAHKEFATGQEALNYRAAVSLRAQSSLTPQERQAMSQPMSVREALETAIQIAAPLAAGPAVKGGKKVAGKAVEINKAIGERGSVVPPGGEPPPPSGAPAEPPAATPTPPVEPPRKAPTAAERLAGGFEPEPRANMARVGAPEDIKALIADMDVTAQKAGLIKLERITHEQTAAGAKAKDMTIKRAFDLVNSWESLHENATAIRDLRDHIFTQLKVLELEANSGDPIAIAKAENGAVIAGVMEEIAVKAGEHMGRGLSSFNIMSEAARAYGTPGALSEMLANWRAGLLPGDSLIARLGQLRSKAQKQVFLRQMVHAGQHASNFFYSAWINGLISNPVSHAANFVANALVTAWGPVERQMAGVMNVVITHDPQGVRMGEAAIMLRAAITAQKKSTQVAWQVLRTGKDVFGSNKMEVAPSLTGEMIGLSPGNPLTHAVDFTNFGVQLPGRMMMTGDAYFKWENYVMDMEARAWREAGIRGLKGEERANFMREWLDSPDAARRAPSEDFAAMQTFTRMFTRDSLSGRLGEVAQLMQRFPVIGRLMIPFTVTPINVGGYAWRRTPLLSVLSESFIRDLNAGGAARDLALARQGTAAMMAMAYMEFSSAGLCTGAGVEKGDAKDALKELGRQDYAVRSGDDLYKINRLSPPGLMVGALCSYAEIAAQLPEQASLELGVGLAMIMAEGIKDQPFFQQINHITQAIQNPGSFTKNFIESNVRSLIPYSGLLHQVKKTGIPGVLEPDPEKRETKFPTNQAQLERTLDAEGRVMALLKEWEKLKNIYAADLPNFSTTVPSKKNMITGDPAVLPPGWGWSPNGGFTSWVAGLASPVTVTHLQDDPVFESIRRNRPSLAEFPDAIPGKLPPALQMDVEKTNTPQALPLTMEEKDQGVKIQTREIQIDGKNLYQTMRDLVTRPEFQAKTYGPGSAQTHEIEKLYRKFQDEAIKEFRRRNPVLNEGITEVLEQRMQRKRGDADKPMPPVQIAPGMYLPGARR